MPDDVPCAPELDAHAAALLAEWLAMTPVPVHEDDLERLRSSTLLNPDVTGTAPAVWSVTDTLVPGRVDIPVRMYRPSASPTLPVVVYAHGGGWTLLSIDHADVLCRNLALRTHSVVVSVGYRLAPEHRFPAAFDDVWDVVAWAAGGGLGHTPPRLGVGGDSAGGNLSAAVALRARDTAAFGVDLQLLLYPAIDPDLDTPSMRDLGPDPRFRLGAETMAWFWQNYLGAARSADVRAAPMQATDFSGVAPCVIATAGFDPLKDDGIRFADALRESGVRVDHVHIAELPHGFAMMLGAVPAARPAFDRVLDRVRQVLHPVPELAAEFRSRPFGRHSEDLQRLLHQMRSQPIAGKHFLFMTRSQEQWVLGRYHEDPPLRTTLDWSVTFTDLEEAEWHVFKLRWREIFGEVLEPDIVAPAGAASPMRSDEERTRIERTPAVIAYADRRSLRAGERIEFFVSCEDAGDSEVEFDARLVRLRSPDIGPLGPVFRTDHVEAPLTGRHRSRHQILRPGSWAEIPGPLPLPTTFSFSVRVQPTVVDRGHRIIAEIATDDGHTLTVDHSTGTGLRARLLHRGRTVAEIATQPLRARAWTDVVVGVDRTGGALSIENRPQDTPGFPTLPPATATCSWDVGYDDPNPWPHASITLAASSSRDIRPEATTYFTGKLERPRLFATGTGGSDPIAEWDFSREIPTDVICDVGPGGFHGRLHNLPTRGTRGSQWDGSSLSWVDRPEHYDAIHFHEDDLADAGWAPSLTFDTPADLASGCYALRVAPIDASTAEFWVPFMVRPAEGRATALAAFVVPTTTYGAYANMKLRVLAQFNELAHGRLTVLDSTDLLLLTTPELGASTYDVHGDGSPVVYSTMNRPVTNFRPTGRLYKFCLDLMIVDWLDRLGFDVDIVTDDDLHHEGLLALAPYRVAITGSHPEYLTRRAFDAFEAFTRRGGRLMYLGGNGFYSAAEISDDHHDVTEVRRPGQDNLWRVNHAEGLFSSSGRPGGLWRNIGRPENAVIGVGFITQGFDACTSYGRSEDSHVERTAWIFDGLDGIDVIGDFGILQGGAAGYEIDRHDVTKGSPAHSVVLASSSGHSNLYDLMVPSILDTLPDPTRTQEPIRADMVFFETDNGGAVFSVGSIAWAGSLSHGGYHNSVSQVTENVLRRFMDPVPFVVPGPT